MAVKKKTSRKKTSKKVSKKVTRTKKKSAKKTGTTKAGSKAQKDVLKLFGQPKISVTEKSKVLEIFQTLQASRQRIKESSANERIKKLKKLRDAIGIHQKALCEAVYLDFHKPYAETELTEIIPVLAEITDAINNLRYWMAPRQVDTPLALATTSSYVCYEPLGTVLVLSPWNYPFQLAIAPLIPAIAAGNTVLIKPSEYTPHMSRFLKEFIEDLFPEDEVAVVEGDSTTAQLLTTLPFDHIFFTGSTPVGKIVMKAASENLCAVTLELGGKSPVIVDETANLKKTAQRVMWGKCVNAGQTCIAPDYLFIPEDKLDEFLFECKTVIHNNYGHDAEAIQASADYCRIINAKNFARLDALIDASVKAGGQIRVGGHRDKMDNFIEPTIITGIPYAKGLLLDEIFGPILPVLTYSHIEEVYEYILGHDKPLALYIFSSKNKNINKILSRTTAGGTSINDVMLHIGNSHLPFGGVNQSGHGKYHGEYGFKAMSNERAVLRQGWLSTVSFLYPPYTKMVQRMIRLTRKYLV